MNGSAGDSDDASFIDAGMATALGGRTENQDRAFVSNRFGVVSDGMGGYAGGARAAELTVAAVQDTLAGLDPNQIDERTVLRAVERANDAVRQGRRIDLDRSEMGSTVTIAVMSRCDRDGSVWLIGHVGDSPAFLVMAPEAVAITVDHTVPAQMVSTGALSSADAEVHPYRHVLLRAIGTEDEIHVDLTEVHLVAGDALLLATDGLSNELAPAELNPIIDAAVTAEAAADALVRAAVARGASDNVTAVVLRHVPSSEPTIQVV